MGVLGTCPASGTFATQLPYLQISEVSTIAAAYALAPFAVDATHVGSSNTTQGLLGLQNAFVNAGKIYDVSGAHGQSATKASPIGIGILPQALINTLADILSACVNTVQTYNVTGGIIYSAPCMTLLGTALSGGRRWDVAERDGYGGDQHCAPSGAAYGDAGWAGDGFGSVSTDAKRVDGPGAVCGVWGLRGIRIRSGSIRRGRFFTTISARIRGHR